jgi:CBS-domain-containing membrane protein
MDMRRAGEVMIPLDKYPHIPYWFTLRQAIAEIEKSEIFVGDRKSLPRAVLVFNKAYELLGIVRRRDILRGLLPEYLAVKTPDRAMSFFDVRVDPNLLELPYEKMAGALRDQAERRVSEVMVPIGATVDYDDHIMKIISKMVENDLNLIPVLRDNRVVGVVRSVDVLHEVARVVL